MPRTSFMTSPQIVTHTANGRLHDVLSPCADKIDFHAIAEGLSKINRYNGSTSLPYSVAQHSLLVADLLPESCKPYGLLHDAHEAFIGDITTPVTNALNTILPGAKDTLDALKSRFDAVIHKAAGLEWPAPKDVIALVTLADITAAEIEKRDLMPTGSDMPYRPQKYPAIKAMAWPDAADQLYVHFKIYLPKTMKEFAS